MPNEATVVPDPEDQLPLATRLRNALRKGQAFRSPAKPANDGRLKAFVVWRSYENPDRYHVARCAFDPVNKVWVPNAKMASSFFTSAGVAIGELSLQTGCAATEITPTVAPPRGS